MHTLYPILQHLKLSRSEIDLYLLILGIGACTVNTLSKKTDISRPTLYTHLHQLETKGLIHQSMNETSVKVFEAEDPLKIEMIFEHDISELKMMEDKFHLKIPQLQLMKKKSPKNIISSTTGGPIV